MPNPISRRAMLQATGLSTVAAALPDPLAAAGSWPPPLGPGTAKI